MQPQRTTPPPQKKDKNSVAVYVSTFRKLWIVHADITVAY